VASLIKKLVLFTRGIETLWYFSLQLGKKFQKMGYEIFYFDQCAEYDSLLKLMVFAEPRVTAAISFNFDGCSGEEYMIDRDGINFFEAREIPLINIVVDHPFYYHKFLPYLPKDYTQISIDLEHERYLKRFFPEMKRGPFLPLAGTSLFEGRELPGFLDRPYDVVFTGNYTPPSDFNKVIERINDEYTAFYMSIIDDFKTHTHMGMLEGIEKHLRRDVEDLTEEGIKENMPNMIVIDLYVRHFFRGEVVKHLVDAGLKVACVGAGWDRLDCDHPENIINCKVSDSYGCLKMISQGKISLNVMPWFKEGAHDRVFNSMLNGAVCFTDWSQYFQDHLHQGEDIMIYELDELDCLADSMRDLLADRPRWEAMQKAAYQTAAKCHTWAHRAEVIHREILCKIV